MWGAVQPSAKRGENHCFETSKSDLLLLPVNISIEYLDICIHASITLCYGQVTGLKAQYLYVTVKTPGFFHVFCVSFFEKKIVCLLPELLRLSIFFMVRLFRSTDLAYNTINFNLQQDCVNE